MDLWVLPTGFTDKLWSVSMFSLASAQLALGIGMQTEIHVKKMIFALFEHVNLHSLHSSNSELFSKAFGFEGNLSPLKNLSFIFELQRVQLLMAGCHDTLTAPHPNL